MDRKVVETVKGSRTVDGAGVNLVRVLGIKTAERFDPFLMLDSFDSRNPDDYIKGFPFHPHRGIETLIYLKSGAMTHKDSLGNSGTISNGEVQWMTAGSGIMHEEMPQASDRMLGVQLWVNLPQKDKMCRPHYLDIRGKDFIRIDGDKFKLDLISGEYEGHKAHQGDYLPVDFYQIEMEPGAELVLPTREASQVLVFTLEGDAVVAGQEVEEKTCIRTSDGRSLKIFAKEPCSLLFLQADKLKETIAWGGPIVMNTKEELNRAFRELEEGNFLKERPEMD